MLNKEFALEARAGAEKLCVSGQCCAPYDCETLHSGGRLRKVGSGTTCPLEKYHVTVKNDTRPWWERPASETTVTRDEIFALCYCCEHADTNEKNGMLTLTRRDLMAYCCDCPVKLAEDNLTEAEAEASIS